MQHFKNEIDVKRINGIIEKICSDLNTTRGIKAKLTSIGNTSKAIRDDLILLETNIRHKPSYG
jgi:hypothetical protein